MTRVPKGQLLLPSLLDRLLDDEPENRQELQASRTQQLRQLKQSVRRDLQHLLNARVCLRDIPHDMREVRTSVLNYGIPDFGGILLNSSDSQESLRRRVEDVIRQYETRFKQVRVELVPDEDRKNFRSIRLRIDGVLHAEPVPEPVTFDSHVVPSVGEFRVQASDR